MTIGPILGAVVSGGGLVADIMGRNQANAVNWANLFEQRRANRANERMAKSSRTDALGNVIRYDEGLNKWVTDLDPTTKSILGREQFETLMSLIEDAPRNRQAAERRDKRSREADEVFQDVLNEYRYRTPRSEAATVSENQQRMLRERRQGLSEASSVLGRQAVRMGNSGAFDKIMRNVDDMFAGSFADVMSQGRQRGQQEFREGEAFDEGQLLQALTTLGGIADGTTTSPVGNTGAGDWANATQENAIQTLLQTMMGGQDRISAASGRLSQGLAQSANFSPFAGALVGLDFGGQGRVTSEKKQDRLRANVS